MIPERHMKQARRADNGEMVEGYFFYMQYDCCDIPCIATEPLSANDYSEIYSHCYYIVDPATIEDVPVKPIYEKTLVGDYRCPNCNAAFIEAAGITPYCGNCGQRLNISAQNPQNNS